MLACKGIHDEVLWVRIVCGCTHDCKAIAVGDAKKIVKSKKIQTDAGFLGGDPDGIRTHDTAVKGRCLNRLTTGPQI